MREEHFIWLAAAVGFDSRTGSDESMFKQWYHVLGSSAPLPAF